MNRLLTLAYGASCYAVFFAAFIYLLGFLANFGVPKGIDDGAPPGLATALVVNLGLIALFGLQHSVMARPWFKRWWTRMVPEAAERSTYVLATSIVLFVIFCLWQPMPEYLWRFEAPWLRYTAWGLFVAGFGITLLSTFMVDHFDLVGLRQVYLRFVDAPYEFPPFKIVGFYRLVRHPLYTGMFVGLWATPDMTLGHLVFAAGMTLYVFIGVRYEERDLVTAMGEQYSRYQQAVPAFIPRAGKTHAAVREGAAATAGTTGVAREQ